MILKVSDAIENFRDEWSGWVIGMSALVKGHFNDRCAAGHQPVVFQIHQRKLLASELKADSHHWLRSIYLVTEKFWSGFENLAFFNTEYIHCWAWRCAVCDIFWSRFSSNLKSVHHPIRCSGWSTSQFGFYISLVNPIPFNPSSFNPVQSFSIQSSLIRSTSVLKARWVQIVTSPTLHPNSAYDTTSDRLQRDWTRAFKDLVPDWLIILHCLSRLGCKLQSVFLNRDI